MSERWRQMEQILVDNDCRCLWQQELPSVGMLECWLVDGLPAIFLAYERGGFDVYTSHGAPRQVSDVLPWLRWLARAPT